MTLIAKREEYNNKIFFQTLKGHSIDSIKILRKYMDINKSIISQFCKRWDLDEELLLKNLFLFVYLHDIGKAITKFQDNILNGKRSQKYPHAYYSLFLLENFKYNPVIKEVPIEKLAILGHHTQLYNEIYDDSNSFIPTFEEKLINNFIKDIKSVYEHSKFQEFFKLPDIEFYSDFKFIPNSVSKSLNKLKKQTQKFKKKPRLKSIFTFFFSVLQLCDDYSSSNFSDFAKNYDGNEKCFDSVMDSPEKYVYNMHFNLIKNIFNNIEPYEFQKELSDKHECFSLLFAPCGRGKTEASLSWAMNVMREYHRNKIIFAMPTQVTSNAMWERLGGLFGDENVGLFHGKSFIKLKSAKNQENQDNINFDEIKNETFKGNIFFKPITITTIDHLVYSFVHGFSQADFALGNLQNSVIIFDEVHYYEEETLNHLFTLFKLLKQMKIPHLLMTGTLPSFIENKLEDYCEIIDKEGLNYTPFSFNIINEELVKVKDEEFINKKTIEEIFTNYSNDLKQFIIVNTINRAKKIYESLKHEIDEKNIILYHSQFTYADRIKKEEEIIKKSKLEGGFVLVATQIIEVSLDISCDLMYTEFAPPDAIGQRGGRLNRKGKTNEGKIKHEMKIFKPENELPYPPEVLNKTVSVINNHLVNYNYIKKLCDVVYNNRDINDKTNLKKLFKDCTLFGHRPSDIAFSEEEGKHLELRPNKFQKIDVVPISVYKDDEDNLNAENLAKIPLWWYLKNNSNYGNPQFFDEIYKNGNKKYIVCNMVYDSEYGFNNLVLDESYYNDCVGK